MLSNVEENGFGSKAMVNRCHNNFNVSREVGKWKKEISEIEQKMKNMLDYLVGTRNGFQWL